VLRCCRAPLRASSCRRAGGGHRSGCRCPAVTFLLREEVPNSGTLQSSESSPALGGDRLSAQRGFHLTDNPAKFIPLLELQCAHIGIEYSL
jgi:hypothetical protein